MVSGLGWLGGLTAFGIVSINYIFGFFFLYKSKKLGIKLLGVAGLISIGLGSFWLGPVCDLISLLITGKNLNPIYLYGFICYTLSPLMIIPAMYLGGELIIPKNKKYLCIIFLFISVIFELFLWLDISNVFTFELNNPGEDIIDSRFNMTHPSFYLMLISLISILIFLGVGFLIKFFRSTGVLRKKSLFLSISFFIYVIQGVLETLIEISITIGVVRLLAMTFSFWIYLGLREEPETKIHMKKERKVEGDLFRLYKIKPGEITEVVVKYYKEQEVCLVCKGKVERLSYICPNCRALYCEKCVQSLSDLENICWVCNQPFNKSKPTKPYKKVSEGPEILK